MFIPLGFGNWPRLFPFVIAILTGICIVWSFSFFPVLKNADKDFTDQEKKLSSQNIKITKTIFLDTCLQKFKDTANCNLVLQKINEAFRSKKEKSKKNAEVTPVNKAQYRAIMKFGKGFLKRDPAKWPKEAHEHGQYRTATENYKRFRDELINVFKKYDLTSQSSLNLFNLVRATFTHASFMHLFGNLLFLIIFGLWVEQRVGAVWTTVVFFAGSIVGIVCQTGLHPGNYVLGASAGISSLMGAFFVFFYWAEFHFCFTLGFLYFKRVVMPLLWVFPAFYLLSDFAGVVGTEESSTAHLAHLMGFLVGSAFALFHKKRYPVSKGHLFPQEEELLVQLRQSSQPAHIWHYFNEVMKWNVQNKEAAETFLMKGSQFGVGVSDEKEIKLCNRYISIYMSKCFRLGSVKEILQAVSCFPSGLALSEFISEVPLRQLLSTADISAQNGFYHEALILYNAAVPKLSNDHQRVAVNQSIQKIYEIFQQNNKVSGGI